ncbi:DinB family protein [Streptococcus suis]|uniref:DinB family protein n=1 Tax=Streptococcus suis TaxID=1307 RepID=UPI0019243495|nr:DinB family protein [Streptococcus suis]MBL1126668.1 DinB family protein [Streptococcus suis]
MKELEMYSQLLDRLQQRFLSTLDQMTVEEANTMPQPLIKSVTWLIWHSARILDLQFSPLLGIEPLYFSEDWEGRFDFGLPRETLEGNQSSEEAAQITVSDKQVLADYLQESVTLAKDYLIALDEKQLTTTVNTRWSSDVPLSVWITAIVDDVAMHAGQAVYTRRLVIGK